MSTVASSHDWAQRWAHTERRRQRAVILLLLLLLFLFALAPRNERRLFVFAAPAGTGGGTIEIPEPTSLRSAIFEHVLGQARQRAEPKAPEPSFFHPDPDHWRDALFDPDALMPEVDDIFSLAELPEVAKAQRRFRPHRIRRYQFGTMTFATPASASAPVPEPTSWALLTLGIAIVGARLRSGRGARPSPA